MKLKLLTLNLFTKRILCLMMVFLLLIRFTHLIPSNTSYAYDYLSKGIDVSVHQGTIDWKKVASDGIDFAILRSGLGKYSYQEDANFQTYYSNATNQGLKVGTYWVSYAMSIDEAYEEADVCYSVIKNYSFDFPVYYDMEVSSQSNSLSKKEITNIALAFCERITSYGYSAGVYANKNWFTNYIDKTQLTNNGYAIWLAQYPSGEYAVNPEDYDKSSECGVWQYSSKGSVSGISGNVDVNVSYIDYAPTIYLSKPAVSANKSVFVPGETAKISWNKVKGATGYWLDVWKDGDHINSMSVNDTDSYDFNVENGEYGVFITAYSDKNNVIGATSDVCSFSVMPKPDAPVATLKSVTTNSATITWNKVTGASSYKVTFRKAGEEYEVVAESLTGTSYSKSGLEPNTQYYLRVYAVNAAGQSARSETVGAKTSQASFKVTFNANGGTTPTASKAVTNGSKYGTLPTPIYAGYTFNGWYTDKSGGTKITADTVANLSGDQTLYAQWTVNTLSTIYNINGGVITDGSPAFYADKDGFVYKAGETDKLTVKYNYGKSSDLYNATSFDMYCIGYAFKGWSTVKSGGTILDQDEKYTFDNNFMPDLASKSCSVTLYAQWEPLNNVGLYYYENASQRNYLLGSDLNKIDGIIKSNNSDVSSINIDSDVTYRNEKVLSLDVLKSGNALQTKTSLSGCATSGSYPEDKIVYLSFYAKSGVPDAKVSVRFGYDDQYSEVQLSTTWKYYVLEMHKVPVSDAWIHWYLDTAGTYELSHLMVSDKKPVEGDFIASSETGAIKTDKSFKQGSPYGELYIPERKGYKFLGWFTDNSSADSKQITADTIAEGNIGVFAHWLLLGDVNADNQFNIADAVLLQRWLLGDQEAKLTNWQAADLCEDGRLDVFDMIVIKQLLVEEGSL